MRVTDWDQHGLCKLSGLNLNPSKDWEIVDNWAKLTDWLRSMKTTDVPFCVSDDYFAFNSSQYQYQNRFIANSCMSTKATELAFNTPFIIFVFTCPLEDIFCFSQSPLLRPQLCLKMLSVPMCPLTRLIEACTQVAMVGAPTYGMLLLV